MNKFLKIKNRLSHYKKKIPVGSFAFASKISTFISKSAVKLNKQTQSSFQGSLSAHGKELFIKRLSYLLKAGIPIIQGLEMIKEQTRSNSQKRIIESLRVSVDNGQPLSAGLKRFKNVFGEFIISVVRVGEKTGTLDQNLDYLAEELKKRRLLKRKIVGSLVYPIFIAIATICITIFLIVFIFPKILPVLKSLNVPLPLVTRIFIGLSAFLSHYGLLTFAGLVVLIIAITLILKIPKVNSIILEYSVQNPAISRNPFHEPILKPCLMPISALHPVSGFRAVFGKRFSPPIFVFMKRSAIDGNR